MKSRPLLTSLILFVLAGILSSCQTSGDQRYTGRRWYVHAPGATCRFWGYIKKPGQTWAAARLTVLDEREGIRPPDRSEVPGQAPFTGDDHNYEYSILGKFTGRSAYDPNSDLVLPVFAARNFILLSQNPGALPGVGEPHDNGFVPAREAAGQTTSRMRY